MADVEKVLAEELGDNVDYAALMRYLDLTASFGKLMLVLNDQDAILDSPSDIKEAIEEVKNAIFLMRRRWGI